MTPFSQLPLADKLKQAQRGDIVVTDSEARLPFIIYAEDIAVVICAPTKHRRARISKFHITNIIRPSEPEREVPEIIGKLREINNSGHDIHMKFNHLVRYLADHFEGKLK